MKESPLSISAEVSTALNEGRPVIALESTILSHGLPEDTSIDAALNFEQCARDAGAVPATIAIIDGKIVIGANSAQIERVCTDPQRIKISNHSLARACALALTGGTTVATTTHLAQLAGIKVMATGGIGGVHRDVNATLDISNDIHALARNRITVVCAGIKSILDIPRTLELLETTGVALYTWRTNNFPAFYCLSSNIVNDNRFDELVPLANAINTHWQLGMAGVVIANPPPSELALDPNELNTLTTQALLSAEQSSVTGKSITPYVLSYLAEHSNGATLTLNLALVESNIRLAANLATTLCQIP